ncbi:hypothetical protein FLTE109939_01945 [Flavobacterium terrigena]|uniref:Uncharacterized protein n=2 Tax=Flavobacterium terrigena TaxID=402734 RepID=A0A1H6Q918_9FLAO|nr:hypothetical protein SAMN05660918_0363 [Flavobacterium terrigena]
MKLNREWHKSHKMPKNPTLEQRIDWHIEHSKNCNCRKIPTNLIEKIQNNSSLPLLLPRFDK